MKPGSLQRDIAVKNRTPARESSQRLHVRVLFAIVTIVEPHVNLIFVAEGMVEPAGQKVLATVIGEQAAVILKLIHEKGTPGAGCRVDRQNICQNSSACC